MPESRELRPATNWAILALATGASAAMLWLATHANHTLTRVAAAVVFGFTNNTIFSLLHEAVHRSFDRVAWRNEMAGHLAAAWFPTALTMQRAFHMTHHTNNRGEEERFDFLAPGENALLKTVQWFSILTGVYGFSSPAFALVYVWIAELVPWQRLVPRGTTFATQTSAHAYLDAVISLPVWRVRAEVAWFVAFQVGLAVLMDLSWVGWLLCYVAFAITWSSQQYANHAYTVLDRDDGAWNIRVSRVTRLFFLNYHDHLAHHQDTARPWHALPAATTPDQPSIPLLRILYLMWKGPKLLPGVPQPPTRQQALDRAVVVAHVLVFGMLFLGVYGSASAGYAGIAQVHDVAMAADRLIPFVPAAGVAYLTLVPLLLVTAVVLRRPERTLPFTCTLAVQLLVAWCCFQLVPVALPTVPGLPADSPWVGVMRLVDVTNLHGNGLPSLHTAFALSCAWVCAARVGVVARVALWAWALAIVASTLLTYQHYLADVVAGAALAVAAMAVVHPRLVRALADVEREVASAVGRMAAA